MKKLFVTGTGTDVGKTYVTGLLVRQLRQRGKNAGYYKAVLSGAEKGTDGRLIPGDAGFVRNTAGLKEPPEKLVSYCYEMAVSPHLAARMEGNPPEREKILKDFTVLAERYEYLTVEGSGGIICPLRWDKDARIMLEDVVRMLDLPLLLVADAGLGTLNATALTAFYLREKGFRLRGIILNRYRGDLMQEDNLRMVQELTGTPVAGTVAPGGDRILEISDPADLYE